MISRTIVKSVCITHCATQWCCSTRYFSPPPLRRREVDAIAAAGNRNFFRMRDGTPVLRSGNDGYCICFDRENRGCTIYPVRPGDCRLFPFDFYQDRRGRFRWLLWDCPLSRRLSETDIRTTLIGLERRYASFIQETLAYGLDDYPAMAEVGDRPKTRILRPLRLFAGHRPFSCPTPEICQP